MRGAKKDNDCRADSREWRLEVRRQEVETQDDDEILSPWGKEKPWVQFFLGTEQRFEVVLCRSQELGSPQ